VSPLVRRDRPGTALVTGAARGIGLAIASRLLAAGWRVGMYDVDLAAVRAAAAGRPGAVAGALDVRDPDQWRTALAELCGDGPLDLMVNNAGVLASGPFTSTSAETHRRIVEVNVLGVVNGCREGHAWLRRSDRALLLNLCSASALYGQPALATYGATKAAVKSLTEALDLEWRADGIRVRSLLPLFVATDMVARDARGAVSVGRLGVRLTADDVADAAVRVVRERWRLLRSPHRPVGPQTRLLAAASAVSPDWAQRLVVERLAG
jgi:NAD(P)-dependent dehydrogenase (short-subunit alcohol dehydrogenase family)